MLANGWKVYSRILGVLPYRISLSNICYDLRPRLLRASPQFILGQSINAAR